ncbi:Sur7 protein [Saccharomycopsis crataegensis]|uniref:Sur7 protein n=1 Tax=Saccharomycopsis crataegensis TaxID=43959 RepID=A0AAV5QL81_9ASCO|nr:Sur7 protein [Saccharomycopsis crataegensis]
MVPNRFHIRSGVVALIFSAAATLFLFFIILSGSSKNPSTPLNRFYWVEADTSSISGAPARTRWTYWGVCEQINSHTKNCTGLGPAVPISPVNNFQTEDGVPSYFINNKNSLYYLSRVGWGLLFVTLAFSVICVILASVTICSHHAQALTSFFSLGATIFNFGAAALLTAAIAMTKKHFSNSSIGSILMGFLWTSAVCNLITLVATFGSFVREYYRRSKAGLGTDESMFTNEPKKSVSTNVPLPDQSGVGAGVGPSTSQPVAYENPYGTNEAPAEQPAAKSRAIKFFSIKKNKKLEEEI